MLHPLFPEADVIRMVHLVTSTVRYLDPAVRQFCTDSRLRGHRAETIGLRRRVLNNAADYFGKPILEATEDQLLAWFRRYLSHSQATRVTYGRTMRVFWSWALSRKLVPEDLSTSLPIPKTPQGVPRPISPEDLQAALLAADPRMRLWLMLGAGAGLRSGEVARLRREEIHVGEAVLKVVDGKGGKDRTVPIGPALTEAIDQWRTRPGRMWEVSAHTVSVKVGTHFAGLGITHTFHACRHRYATTFYRASGHDVFATMAVLGHSSPNYVRVYAQSDPARSIDALAALDTLLRGEAAA